MKSLPLLFLCLLFGCASTLKVIDRPNTKGANESLSSIKTSANTIDTKAPAPEVKAETDNIRTQADSVGKELNKTAALEKALLGAKEKLKASESKAAQLLNYVIAACAVGVGISIALAAIGGWKSYGAALGFLATIGVSIFVLQALHYGWIVFVAGSFLALGALVYAILSHRKALAETVLTTEVLKPKLSLDAFTGMFGEKGKASELQSASTQRLVSKARTSLGLKDSSPLVVQSINVDAVAYQEALSQGIATALNTKIEQAGIAAENYAKGMEGIS